METVVQSTGQPSVQQFWSTATTSGDITVSQRSPFIVLNSSDIQHCKIHFSPAGAGSKFKIQDLVELHGLLGLVAVAVVTKF